MSQGVRCLIVDDEPLAITVIQEYIEQVPQLELVGTCADAMEAFQLLNKQKIDLLFLDIEMPGISGIDFIKSLAAPPQVILTTAFREYAIESYEVQVVDYLLKPISFNRFFKAVNKYLTINTESKVPSEAAAAPAARGSIYVYSEKKNVKIYFENMLYVESIKDYVRIHTTGKNVVSKMTISGFQELLPATFLRVHRSYIVNMRKITAFTHHDVEIGAKEIPIGVSYKKSVLEQLKD